MWLLCENHIRRAFFSFSLCFVSLIAFKKHIIYDIHVRIPQTPHLRLEISLKQSSVYIFIRLTVCMLVVVRLRCSVLGVEFAGVANAIAKLTILYVYRQETTDAAIYFIIRLKIIREAILRDLSNVQSCGQTLNSCFVRMLHIYIQT